MLSARGERPRPACPSPQGSCSLGPLRCPARQVGLTFPAYPVTFLSDEESGPGSSAPRTHPLTHSLMMHLWAPPSASRTFGKKYAPASACFPSLGSPKGKAAPMLLLTRRPGEAIVFPTLGITVRILAVRGNDLRLGIEA